MIRAALGAVARAAAVLRFQARTAATVGKTAEALSAKVENWIESEMPRTSPHLHCGEAALISAAPALRP
ncbi:MAG: hypothetical protein ROZ64_03600 [Burkholderiaceae bacterium]|nr:hypothetical protein [Burkholderiaceae bacterium]